MGAIALLETGDRLSVDLGKCQVNIVIDDAELQKRKEALAAQGGYAYPESQTPWQEIQRGIVDQLDEGMVLKNATKYLAIAQKRGLPRDSH